MDISLTGLVKIVTELGPLGLLAFFWWYDNRRIWTVMEQNKQEAFAQREQASKQMAVILAQYKEDMGEQREMYRANASLCRDFSSVAGDLRDIVSLNIQSMTEVKSAVDNNQFCPMVRIQKVKRLNILNENHQAEGREGGK